MASDAPIEVTTKYVTSVEDLPAAWGFVMTHVDRVGADPHIEIHPIWWYDDDGSRGRRFEVVVSGMVRGGE